MIIKDAPKWGYSLKSSFTNRLSVLEIHIDLLTLNRFSNALFKRSTRDGPQKNYTLISTLCKPLTHFFMFLVIPCLLRSDRLD